MHYCAKCGTEVLDEAKFCPKCGAIQKNQRKEYNNSEYPNDYTAVMPKVQPRMEEDAENYEEDNGSNNGILKLVIIGILIGIVILTAGYAGYYFYTSKSESAYKQINKTVENTADSKSTSQDKDDNKSSSSNDAAKNSDSNKNKQSSDYIFYDSSNVKLTDNQLNSLSKESLSLARNEIYARHGYVFQTEPFKSYFSNKSWYKANPNFKGSDEEINEVERYNVQLLLKYENNK